MFLYQGAYNCEHTWMQVATVFILFDMDLTAKLKVYRSLI